MWGGPGDDRLFAEWQNRITSDPACAAFSGVNGRVQAAILDGFGRSRGEGNDRLRVRCIVGTPWMASNLFIGAGVMPLSRWLEAGVVVGLGSDVSGGPDPSIFGVMRAGAFSQMGLRVLGHETRPPLTPLDWLRLGTLERADKLHAGQPNTAASRRSASRPTSSWSTLP